MAGETFTNKILQLPAIEEEPSFAQVVRGIAILPSILALLREQQQQLAALRAEICKPVPTVDSTDGWLDARGAAKYLGVSAATFDKYRYQTTPKIKGYKLDGKVLYKRADLDSFVRLYELKSGGLA